MVLIFINRIVRACKLDAKLYEEVEADKSATLQAAGVVVLSIIALGIGTFLAYGAFNVLFLFQRVYWVGLLLRC